MTDKLNRRNFATATGVAAAVAAATGMSVQSSQAQEAKPDRRFPPPPATPEKAAWVESEREKWDALNAHMTPQFEGQRAYNEHGFAKYR